MEQLTREQIQTLIGTATEMSSDELEQLNCDKLNKEPGYLNGYDCPLCLNRGYTYKVVDGRIVAYECGCRRIREAVQRCEQTGNKKLNTNTLDTYRTLNDWQRNIKDAAVKYLDSEEEWFFVGGQPGAGKTHVCTAVFGELVKRGTKGKYMLWKDEAAALKSLANTPEYGERVKEYKNAELLYIDDFFRGEVTTGDKNLAFEIINARYNADLKTIISSEKYMNELLCVDESTASRISEKCGEFKYTIQRDFKKNWRVKR